MDNKREKCSPPPSWIETPDASLRWCLLPFEHSGGEKVLMYGFEHILILIWEKWFSCTLLVNANAIHCKCHVSEIYTASAMYLILKKDYSSLPPRSGRHLCWSLMTCHPDNLQLVPSGYKSGPRRKSKCSIFNLKTSQIIPARSQYFFGAYIWSKARLRKSCLLMGGGGSLILQHLSESASDRFHLAHIFTLTAFSLNTTSERIFGTILVSLHALPALSWLKTQIVCVAPKCRLASTWVLALPAALLPQG